MGEKQARRYNVGLYVECSGRNQISQTADGGEEEREEVFCMQYKITDRYSFSF